MGFNFKRPQKTFKIGEYYTVPKYIHTKSCNSYDLEKKREESLLESKNPNNIAFEGFIERLRTSTYKKGELDYIKEFPLLIDRSVYQDIARLRLPSELAGCDEIFNKSFILLDYFFPKLGIAVELDSHYHDQRKPLDLVRDIYTETYFGISTIRVDGYGVRGDTVGDNKFNNRLKKLIKNIIKHKTDPVEKGGLGLDVDIPVDVDFNQFMKSSCDINLVGLDKALFDVGKVIYTELGTTEEEVIVPEGWLDSKFPFWVGKDNAETIEKLQDTFYKRYKKPLLFKSRQILISEIDKGSCT